MIKVSSEELEEKFEAPEGELNMYYGVIGGGKTYNATADIHELLKKGRVVYATWPILVKNFDDRVNIFMRFMNFILFRKRYYSIPCKENFHYIDVEKGEVDGKLEFNPNRPSEYIEYLNDLNHCTLFIDEAWRIFDSYKGTMTSLDTRNLALVTRHKFRTINVIAQRPTSVQVTIRGNINRYYKCVKLSPPFLWFPPRFARYEFQEMSGETVNEDIEPISKKTYWGRKAIFRSYNSYYYGDLTPLHGLIFEAWDLNFIERFLALIGKKVKETQQKEIEPNSINVSPLPTDTYYKEHIEKRPEFKKEEKRPSLEEKLPF